MLLDLLLLLLLGSAALTATAIAVDFTAQGSDQIKRDFDTEEPYSSRSPDFPSEEPSPMSSLLTVHSCCIAPPWTAPLAFTCSVSLLPTVSYPSFDFTSGQ